MKFTKYAQIADKTDQFPDDPERSIECSLTNLYKELTNLHQTYSEEKTSKEQTTRLVKKVGDILWYLNNFSKHCGFSLEDAAKKNIDVIEEKFGNKSPGSSLPDTGFQLENLPEKVDVAFIGSGEFLILATELKNQEFLQLGDRINDNSHSPDHYRYHDVFHLAFMACLGWSPVMRSLFKRKRKNNPKLDEIEDGARAGDLEEAITVYVFQHAKENNFFENHDKISFEILHTVGLLTRHLEAKCFSYSEWQRAILEGFKMYRLLKKHDGGIVSLNRRSKSIAFKRKEEAGEKLKKLFDQYKSYKKVLSKEETIKELENFEARGTEKLTNRKKASNH